MTLFLIILLIVNIKLAFFGWLLTRDHPSTKGVAEHE